MRHRPYRTLLLWFIWASAAIGAYFGFYHNTGVWEFLAQDKTRITWVILVFFIFGIIASLALSFVIMRESLVLRRIEQQIKEKGLIGYEMGSIKRAVSRYFLSLRLTMESNSKPDAEALLNVELAGYQRMSRSIEVAGNLLITLGLIGTVMGLTLTLTGLTSSLDALGHDQEQLLAGLRKAMGGMGTAFYTTLLGAILGGVLLRVFAQITEQGVEGLYDRTMHICLVYCAADFKPSLERDVRFLDAEMESLGEKVQYLSQAFSASRMAMEEFREEVGNLRSLSQEERTALLETIEMNRQAYMLMRQEARLMKNLNRTFWQRCKDLIRIRPRPPKQ